MLSAIGAGVQPDLADALLRQLVDDLEPFGGRQVDAGDVDGTRDVEHRPERRVPLDALLVRVDGHDGVPLRRIGVQRPVAVLVTMA
jgi:hypothetical protein